MDPVARAWGRAAEDAVRRAYTRLGYFVVPAHAIEDGGAPMLIGLLRKYVLPDFLVAKGGIPRWLEVKYKDHCVKYQKTGFFRHGIDRAKWDSYRKVEKITGIPGSIAIIQYRPGASADPFPHLLEQSYSRLEQTVQFAAPTAHAPTGMVYWNVDDMEIVTPLDFQFTDLPRLTEVIHAWEQKSKSGHAPAMDFEFQQRSLFTHDRSE